METMDGAHSTVLKHRVLKQRVPKHTVPKQRVPKQAAHNICKRCNY